MGFIGVKIVYCRNKAYNVAFVYCDHDMMSLVCQELMKRNGGDCLIKNIFIDLIKQSLIFGGSEAVFDRHYPILIHAAADVSYRPAKS
ncbi:hypothetical protein HME9302_00253 [Alteripontixanthobacter maritimus]|uniref:Uncharacterized protein n=1 Tax=Alteripontixanthobacter maritimus TaxID=2161824 RepID=A0A369Q6D4_9SPHN|nr:hypothetical protein HME9302_00253 [Alteripontixanthobacter maritimus]